MYVSTPKLPPDHPDYLIEAEFVLEPAIQAVAEAAERAGWTSGSICVAISRLAGARAQQISADAMTDEAIADAMKQRRS